MDNVFAFHRPDLANHYCLSLEGAGLLDSRSGLFLAAPRRTGKSTFLREDLLPVMRQKGWVTIYVDLWSDKSENPAALITRAVKAKLATFSGVIAKMARATGLEKVTVFGALSLNLESLELPEGITLSEAIEALAVAAEAPVAIIIDEAQHALTTQEGMNAMFALKAARDHLNQGSQGQQLYIVLTGSNRDKLAHLVLKRDQPFYGSQVTKFPLLGKEFAYAYTAFVNQFLATGNQFSPDDIFEIFKIVGHRPEMLRHIVSDVAVSSGAGHLSEELKSGADVFKSQTWGMMESEFAELPEAQRVVLETMIKFGSHFSPFTDVSMKAYTEALGLQKTVSTATIQAALDALREKGLVWRAAYGAYALEDESMVSWYKINRS